LLHHQVVQHVVEGTRLGARVAPLHDEQLLAKIAHVPGREVALRQHVRPGPVEQRRLAIVVRLLERRPRLRRGAALEAPQRALQPLAAAGNLEVGRAEARLAEAGEETGMASGEGAALRSGQRAHDEIRTALGIGALVQDARHLAVELRDRFQLAQPFRLAAQQLAGALVDRSLHELAPLARGPDQDRLLGEGQARVSPGRSRGSRIRASSFRSMRPSPFRSAMAKSGSNPGTAPASLASMKPSRLRSARANACSTLSGWKLARSVVFLPMGASALK